MCDKNLQSSRIGGIDCSLLNELQNCTDKHILFLCVCKTTEGSVPFIHYFKENSIFYFIN